MIVDRARHRHLRDVEGARDVFESYGHYLRRFKLFAIAASARGAITT